MKEVVHVPTRELAEEVLRVAKENGFHKPFTLKSMLKQVNNKDLCFRFYQSFGFSRLGFYQEKKYKIITAQEFLSRYKDSELDKLRKENENLKAINENLNKESIEYHNELTLLKEKLKAIEDTPKAGDVCLFWDGLSKYYSLEILSEIIKGKECIYRTNNKDEYANCIKATPENIQAKIKELSYEFKRND